MKTKLTIVKVGGVIINDNLLFEEFMKSFSKINENKIIVHGGGIIASNYMIRLGIIPKMVNGRRITDSETLDVAIMTYAGLVNKKIVSNLQKLNCNSIGLSGADGNLIKSKIRKVNKINYGFVGDIEKINDQFLLNLLNSNLTPTICSITHDKNGQLLNTNADTIASDTAIAMSKHYNVTLKYCFDKSGLLMDQNTNTSIKKNLTKKEFKKLVENKIISGGMIPKLENCFKALENGVNNIYVGNIDIINTIDNCTKITL
ncbi:MAG: acetylglutamate kinase [Flavobacteriaceae bacterium]|nr:acetylglutamate kinase [Flavobacteriaceae bacterium]